MPIFKFSVDSALLRELGERLVGKPHIALAELVKNGYDADATNVIIRLDGDAITVSDNGHGMSKDEFRDYWMRIGSPHKAKLATSRKLKRVLTGSKGVGRLSGQFLARKMTIHTVAEGDPEHELVGDVDWDEATHAKDLTQAEVAYKFGTRKTLFPGNSRNGTKIILHGLNQSWSEEDIKNLAREIWLLQPPFRTNPRFQSEKAIAFHVSFEAADEQLTKSFEAQMNAILGLYYVRITGCLVDRSVDQTGEVQLTLEWEDGPTIRQIFQVPHCRLHSADFEIRVYHLSRRQKQGVPVQQARDYLNEFGGVHIYDSGFHLPYYGPQEDWLRTEFDHSHRLSASKLLPSELQVSHGLNYLPTMSRLLGVVNVNTGSEARVAKRAEEGRHLMIQITRDRLVDNEAFQNLVFMVRWALDFYAMQEAAREFEQKRSQARTEPSKRKFERVEEALEQFKDRIEPNAYGALRKTVREAVVLADEEQEERLRQANLLGVLATAGMSAVAFRHEFTKQLAIFGSLVDRMRRIQPGDKTASEQVVAIAQKLHDWHEQAVATQAVFVGVADEEGRQRRFRPKAKEVAETVARHLGVLLGSLKVDTERINVDVRLPEGTFAEWSAILQNILVNAGNAVLDTPTPRIDIASGSHGKTRSLLIQDNGKGVDLSTAEELFRPFVRRLKLSRERQAMGMGGTGVGLTIVRMLAENLGCRVAFVEPEQGFKTAFRLSWSEAEGDARRQLE
jgi:signal transduction histidine kinase